MGRRWNCTSGRTTLGCRELAYKVVGGDHDWPGAGNMDIVSHEVVWDRLKAFNMEGRISCGTVDAEEPSLSTWRVAQPTTDALVIDWGGFHAAEDFAVFNASGQCVMNGTVTMESASLDVGQLRPGLHWIRIAGSVSRFGPMTIRGPRRLIHANKKVDQRSTFHYWVGATINLLLYTPRHDQNSSMYAMTFSPNCAISVTASLPTK